MTPNNFIKGVSYFVLLFLSIYACRFEYKPYRFEVTEQKVELEYGRAMSPQLLDSITAVVKSHNIELRHFDVAYDGSALSKLSFEIIYGGKKVQSSTNFVNKGYGFGFSVNKQNGSVLIGEIFK